MADSPKLPLTNLPGKTNWVQKHHALPKGSWIRRAAEHIHAKGHSTGTSIAFAVNAARKMCASGDTNFRGVQQVNLGSRAEACAAVAIWDKARLQAKASKDLSAGEWFHAIDLAGARLVRGLDLTAEQARVIDLAYDEGRHPRGFHGRWTKVLAMVKDLKPGESRTVHSASGTRVKRLSSGGFKVSSSNGRTEHVKSVSQAAGAAVNAVVRAHRPKRIARNMAAVRKVARDLARQA